jgi:hypothetical protein
MTYGYHLLLKKYDTPRNSSGVPATRTRYALASEIGLLAAGHAVSSRARFSVGQKQTLAIGVVGCS